MSSKISSPPESAKFRSMATIILITILVGTFLAFTDYVNQEARRVARDRVITHIQQSLSMMFYQFTIQNRQQELNLYAGANPMDILREYRSSQVPRDYNGVVDRFSSDLKAGWYFNRVTKRLVYADERSLVEWRLNYFEAQGIGRLEIQRESAL